ncbi:hypothetical protein EMIT0194MI4_90058 [Pseudomonas sp. IT-194MI4]
MWRGSLLPLGCEAALKPETSVVSDTLRRLGCDCCAVEREQAPSPQGLVYFSQTEVDSSRASPLPQGLPESCGSVAWSGWRFDDAFRPG